MSTTRTARTPALLLAVGAAAKLSGLPKGKRTITVSYAGTSSTAATTTTLRTVVK